MKTKLLVALLFTSLLLISCGEKDSNQAVNTKDNRQVNNTTVNSTSNESDAYHSEEGKFYVDFPAEPNISTQAVPTELGDINITMYLVDKGTTAYMVAHNDYPADFIKNTNADPQSLLQGGKTGALNSYNGTLVSEKEIELDGNPGLEFKATGSMQGQEIEILARMYLVENRLYQIVIACNKGILTDEEMTDFVMSFGLD